MSNNYNNSIILPKAASKSLNIRVKHLFSLVLMNLTITKRYILFVAAYSLILPFMFTDFNISMTASSAATVYMIFISLLAYEDKYKADKMTGIMPIGRRAIIISKFLTAFVTQILAFVFGIAAKYITETVLSWYRNEALPAALQLPDLSVISICLLITALCVSIYLPLYYLFGYQKLRIVSLVLFFALFFGGQMLSDLNLPSSLQNTLSRMSMNDVALLIIVCSLAICFVSYYFTYKIYRYKDF